MKKVQFHLLFLLRLLQNLPLPFLILPRPRRSVNFLRTKASYLLRESKELRELRKELTLLRKRNEVEADPRNLNILVKCRKLINMKLRIREYDVTALAESGARYCVGLIFQRQLSGKRMNDYVKFLSFVRSVKFLLNRKLKRWSLRLSIMNVDNIPTQFGRRKQLFNFNYMTHYYSK